MILSEIQKGLPTEYESFLIEKYHSFLTTCRYIQVYYPAHDINYILVKTDNELSDLIVFGIFGHTAYCFNSLVSMDQKLIENFTKLIFDQFSKLKKIKIDASYTEYQLKKSILIFKSDNQILKLPDTVDQYLTDLGQKKRKNAKARQRKLAADFKSIVFTVKFGKEIDGNVVDKIVQFNRCRMKSKGKISGINDEYENSIYKYCKHYGCVSTLELDGEMVAGSIGTLINKDIYMQVISFDENYQSYNVGEVCTNNMINYAIENKWTNFHFLWGRTEFKRRMMADSHDLYSYYVYRNYSLGYITERIKVSLNHLINNCKQPLFLDPVRKKIKNIRIKQSTAH